MYNIETTAQLAEQQRIWFERARLYQLFYDQLANLGPDVYPPGYYLASGDEAPYQDVVALGHTLAARNEEQHAWDAHGLAHARWFILDGDDLYTVVVLTNIRASNQQPFSLRVEASKNGEHVVCRSTDVADEVDAADVIQFLINTLDKTPLGARRRAAAEKETP